MEITFKVLEAHKDLIKDKYDEYKKEYNHYGAVLLAGHDFNVKLVKKGYQCNLQLVRGYIDKYIGKGDTYAK